MLTREEVLEKINKEETVVDKDTLLKETRNEMEIIKKETQEEILDLKKQLDTEIANRNVVKKDINKYLNSSRANKDFLNLALGEHRDGTHKLDLRGWHNHLEKEFGKSCIEDNLSARSSIITGFDALLPEPYRIGGIEDNFKYEMHFFNNSKKYSLNSITWVEEIANDIAHAYDRNAVLTDPTISGSESNSVSTGDVGHSGGLKGYKLNQTLEFARFVIESDLYYKKATIPREFVLEGGQILIDYIKNELSMKIYTLINTYMLVGHKPTESISNSRKIVPIYNNKVTSNQYDPRTTQIISTDVIDNSVLREIAIRVKGAGKTFIYMNRETAVQLSVLLDSDGRLLFSNAKVTDEGIILDGVEIIYCDSIPTIGGIDNSAEYVSGSTYAYAIAVKPQEYITLLPNMRSRFEDFDLNYNTHIYLDEVKCGGMLKGIDSAIAITHTKA